jgi:two-component system chemotaxis response regulator CheB
MARRIRVLIVDDSSVVRTIISRILGSDPEIEVVGTAMDPFVARELLVKLRPDVMTLDVEMPRMDGLTFLAKVMEYFPVRTIMISSLTQPGSEILLKALELGAIDVLAKPAASVIEGLSFERQELIDRIKAAARARLIPPSQKPRSARAPTPLKLARTTHQILAIASSTGGTEALKVVLPSLPPDLPGTVIVQHMPPVFTKNYADHLCRLCPFEVREARDGDRLLPGLALLAPGNFHMVIERRGGHYVVRLNQEPLLHGVRPAADHLMRSVAEHAGANAIGVVLTGMGKDGAAGLKAMRDAGAATFAQDEETCVVYGMPRAAVEAGAVQRSAPLHDLGELIVHTCAQQAQGR